MGHPWWETALLDAMGAAIALCVGSLAAWLAHARGWTRGPLRALGLWLDRNTPTTAKITQEVLDELAKLIDEKLRPASTVQVTYRGFTNETGSQ